MMTQIEKLLEEFYYYIESGGVVMWPLVAGIFLLWFALGYRMFSLQRGSSRSLRDLVDLYTDNKKKRANGIIDTAVARGVDIAKQSPKYIKRFLDDDFNQFTQYMKKYSTLARIIVLVAPLGGLLGTVNGMIEMFDSLGSQTFYSQSGGIARGISEALFTTQLGLVIAVPGMIVERILDKRQQKLEEELEQLKKILCVQYKGA